MNNLKLIDFYELTMSYSDFKDGRKDDKCYFDLFFRKNVDGGGYCIACGLDEIVDYIKGLSFDEEDIAYLRSLGTFDEDFLQYLSEFRFKGSIWAVPDGTPVFPGEPCITVYGNQIEAQIVETDLLNRFNHGSLIATKTHRIVYAAEGRVVMEFGARRAQGVMAAYKGAKYACIAGAAGTSCYETGKEYGARLMGTMAHSHILKYKNEYEAFLAYARTFPRNSVFLVDTYNTLASGVPNAIKVAKDFLIPNGYRLAGIRLDSGDLAYLTKKARVMLDEAGLTDCQICVSNSLDEFLIKDLIAQGAPIDSFGVGENLITAKSWPVFGGVYKLSALEAADGSIIPKMKISNNVGKITNPGYKKVYRFYDKNTGFALGDVIALADEKIPTDGYVLFDEHAVWKKTELKNYTVRELQVPVFIDGRQVYDVPSVEETKRYCAEQIKTLYPELLRLNNPHDYYVDLSQKLYDLKTDMLKNNRV